MKDFEEENPNVKLDIQAIPRDGYQTRLKTVAAADEMPDVFVMWPGTMTEEFQNGGLLQPINEFLDSKPEWKDEFLPGSFDGFTVDGNIYSVPTGLSPTSFLYYNSKLFEDNGVEVPQTWDQLLAAIDTFNQNDITPIALGNKAGWPAQSSVLSSLADRVTGSEWFLEAASLEGDAKFTDDVFVTALEHFQHLAEVNAFQEGFNSIDHTQAEQMFAREEAAMLIDGGWALTELANSASEEVLENLEVTVLPEIEGGEGKPNAISGVVAVGFGIAKGIEGEQKEAAQELMYKLAGPEAQQATVNSSQLVSYRVQPDEEKVTSLFIKVNELLDTVEMSPVYDGVLTSAGTDAINNGLQELLMGEDPKVVAEKLQQGQEKGMQE